MMSPSQPSTEEPDDIALFGGAFDPVTLGHMSAAWAIHAQTGFGVWFTPCYEHRFGKTLSEFRHREQMCRIAAQIAGASSTFRCCSIEHDIKHNGSTYELIQYLRSSWPGTRFHPVMGADNLLRIDEWDRGEQLVAETDPIILNRPGYDIRVWPTTPHHRVDLYFPSSSTDVRNAISDGEYIKSRRMLHVKVWRYICKHGLYEIQGS